MLRSVPVSRQIPLRPEHFLDGVPAISARIQHSHMEPDQLHAALKRVCRRYLDQEPFPIVSRNGVDFVLPGEEPKNRELLVDAFLDVSAALKDIFHARFLLVKPSLIQVVGVEGMKDADMLMRRILSILRFRTQHSIRALATGNILTIPFQEPDRGVLDEHYEAVRDVVADYPMPRPTVKLHARVMRHPVEVSIETPQNFCPDGDTDHGEVR